MHTAEIVSAFLQSHCEDKILYLENPRPPALIQSYSTIAALIFRGNPNILQQWARFLSPKRLMLFETEAKHFEFVLQACNKNERLEYVSLYFEQSRQRGLNFQKFMLFVDTFNNTIKRLNFTSCDFSQSKEQFLHHITPSFDTLNYSDISERRYFADFWLDHNIREHNIMHLRNFAFEL